MSRFDPVPLVLGAYIAITLSQLGFAYLRRLAGILLVAFVVVDVVLLLVLIWSFHIQYMQPPSFSLKAPTLLSVFISSRSALSVSMPDTSSSPGSCGGRLDGARRRGAIARWCKRIEEEKHPRSCATSSSEKLRASSPAKLVMETGPGLLRSITTSLCPIGRTIPLSRPALRQSTRAAAVKDAARERGGTGAAGAQRP